MFFLWLVLFLGGALYLAYHRVSLRAATAAVGIALGAYTLFGGGSLPWTIALWVAFAGLVLLFERSIKVGDFVDLQSGVMGRVSEISMRYTRITTNDSVDMFVPNSELTGGRVINWSYGHNFRRIHVPFGVAYGSDKQQVREAGIEAAKSVEGTIFGPGRDPEVWLVAFGDSSLDFELVVWVSRSLLVSPSRTQAKYLWALETELASRGLEIPFPQRDLHLRSGTLKIEGTAPGSVELRR